MKSAPKQVLEARPHATKVALDIGKIGNTFPDGGVMAGLIACLAMQNVMLSIVMANHQPGSQSGVDMIETLWDNAKRDAIDRWHQDDLKKYMAAQPKGPT